MLEIRDLTVRYPGNPLPALDRLTLSVRDGGLLAVTGPSGCGKTTLLSALAGVRAPDAGALLFDGATLDPRRVPIGYLPQGYGLLPWKTVEENLLFCARLRGVPAEGELDVLTVRLGLSSLLSRFPSQLSGGQAQRVALARALLMKPRLLLMDEPFAALDAAASYTARALCFELWRSSGATALVVTHRLEEALYLADRIAILAPGGRVALEEENPFQGQEDPQDPGWRALLLRLKAAVLSAAGEGGAV